MSAQLMRNVDQEFSSSIAQISNPSVVAIAQLWRIGARIAWATILLLGLIVVGVAGFHHIGGEKTSWSDAIYMTLITISTVGYGEIVPLNTFGARLFAGLMAISGLGGLTFLFTSLTVFFMEKDLDYSLRRRRMEKHIRKLQRHYIVCGFGRVGRNTAHELHKTGRKFIAIDLEQARFDDNLDKFPDLLHLLGDASDDDLLIRANIADAGGVFAVTGDDSINLMIIITAKQINPNVRVVARAQETRNVEKMRKAGAAEIICPDFTGGMRIASAMVRPHVVGFLDEMLKTENHLRVDEVAVPVQFPPTRIGSLRLRSADYILIAVRSNGKWSFNPTDENLLRAGDVVVIMASPAGRIQLEAHLSELSH